MHYELEHISVIGLFPVKFLLQDLIVDILLIVQDYRKKLEKDDDHPIFASPFL